MLARSAAILTALLGAALAAAGCGGPAAEALRAEGEGRSGDAARLFAAAVAEAGGERAPAELHLGLARAALLAGDPEGARSAAAAAARAAAGGEAAGRAAFLEGSASFRLGEAAERAAGEGAARDPRARLAAATRYEDALLAFGRAAADMADGGAARRNAERALLALERVRGAAAKAAGPRPRGVPPGPPPGLPGGPGEPGAEEPGAAGPDLPGEGEGTVEGAGAAAARAGELSPAEVEGVLERLAALERARAAARRARREERGAAVERDW